MPTLDEAQRDAVSLIDAWDDRTTAAYGRAIRLLARRAAERLPRFAAIVAAADGPAGWHPPDIDELLPLADSTDAVRDKTQKDRARYAHTVADTIGTVAAVGVAFNVRNPLIEGVIAKHSGQNIVGITETIRAEIATALQDSWERGDSVPHAARAIIERGMHMSRTRAHVIARTELNSINNGASHAAVQVVNQGALNLGLEPIAKFKRWLATEDARTRKDHAHADGQQCPINETFSVGGYPMAYPGDPDGPAREVVNCRCTLTYTNDAALAASARRQAMPPIVAATETADEADDTLGGAWTALLAQEGVDTGDGRRIEPKALGWRDLPLTLMAMTENAGGHDGSAVAGRIDSVTRNAEDIDGDGVFDAGEYGSEIERLVRAQMLRGVSVDLAVEEWTMEPPDGYEDDPNYEPFFDDTFVVLKGTILGATVCPFPAFAEAKITVASAKPFVIRLAMPFEPRFSRDASQVPPSIDERDDHVQAFVQRMLDLSAEQGITIRGDLELDGRSFHIDSLEDHPEPIAASGVDLTRDPSTYDRLPSLRPARVLEGRTALTAGAAPARPPLAWFQRAEADEPTPLTITDDGQVYGHAALWGTCHLGLPGCTTPPANASGTYSWFHLGELDTDGGLTAVGTITLDTGHASLQANARNAVRHYDDTGTQAAYVRAMDGMFGIWVCGTLKPDLDMAIVRELRAAKLSGDWRPVGGNAELVGLLAVNVPGFPVPREQALMACAENGDTRVMALVAAGIPNEARARAIQEATQGDKGYSRGIALRKLRNEAYAAAGRFEERPTLEQLRERARS